MKRIINGRRYDTEKAERIGTGPVFEGLRDTLYRKRSGEYFYHLTREDGVEAITPATLPSAIKWARRYLPPDDFAAAFGPVPSNSPSALFVDIGKETMAGIRRGAEAEGLTIKAHVERLLREALENPNQK